MCISGAPFDLRLPMHSFTHAPMHTHPPQASIFMSQTIITKQEGGHDGAVHCLQSFGNFLVSSDRNGCMKVWDLTSGGLAQTIDLAHNEAITHLLIWEVSRNR
jgi:hypothetical protein